MQEIKGFSPITFVDEGQLVWIQVGSDLVRCEVKQAMGRTARVVNTSRGIDTWVGTDELRIRN